MLMQKMQTVRFRLNNLTVGSVTAAGSVNVDTVIAAVPTDWIGAVGYAQPVGADLAAGLGAPMASILDATHLRLRFSNGSAGGITPAATLDYDVFIFLPTGAVQQIV